MRINRRFLVLASFTYVASERGIMSIKMTAVFQLGLERQHNDGSSFFCSGEFL